VNPLPNASAGSDATICFGDTTQLNAGGGISYQWSPSAGLDNATIANPLANPSSTTSYVVEVTDANGCRNSDTVTVFVNALPIVSSGGNIAICLGTPGQLNASGGVSYAWTPGTGLSDPSIANPQANPTITTTYTVIVTDANGCSASDQAQVTVNPLPVATAISDTLVCSGAGVGLNAGGGVSYQWSPTIGLSNASAANPVANPGNTTVYTVTVTDVNGCTDEEQVEVSINPQPVAAFEIDTVRLRVNCDGVRIKTINNSTDALSYIWLFGDGNTSTTEEPFYQYPFGANVNLTLIATNGQCADTLVLPQQMLNLEDYLKGLPNTFTPNDDGINDCFELRARLDFEECSTWVIFNRWGEKVYENSNPDGCWNGKRNNDGEPCPSGTYFYVLKVKEASFKGSVHLIR
jgi:gliding motility-associated-like protein